MIQDNIFLQENIKPADWPTDIPEILLVLMYMSPMATYSGGMNV